MKRVELNIEGMSCGHCVMAVKKALSNLNDIKVEDVQIGKAVFQLDESHETLAKVIDAIENAGYVVIK